MANPFIFSSSPSPNLISPLLLSFFFCPSADQVYVSPLFISSGRARADRLFYLLIVGHHHSTAIIHRRRCFLCLWSLWSQDSTEPLPHRLIVDAGPWFFSPLPASSSISHRQRGNEGHWLGEADLSRYVNIIWGCCIELLSDHSGFCHCLFPQQ